MDVLRQAVKPCGQRRHIEIPSTVKIKKISIFQTDLPYVGGSYGWGAGNAISVARASVVVLETECGLTGCGEFTPCGENYIAAHSEGVAATAKLLAPQLLDEDPRQVEAIGWRMDGAIQGHGYAKSPIIAACYDLLGKSCEMPVWMLLGGKLTDGAPMYRVAPQGSVEDTKAELGRHRAAGYRQFQIKVGADWQQDIERIRATVPLLQPGEDAMADANQGWRVDNAIRVANATRDLDYIFEQPCRTYEECQLVRPHVAQPMKLDECVTGMPAAQRIVQDRGAEICCLKIANLGGLVKARRVRDFLVENRIPVVSEDTWGGEITSAVVAHFAASTPEDYLVNSTDLHNYNTRSTGIGVPTVRDGKPNATATPGLAAERQEESCITTIAANKARQPRRTPRLLARLAAASPPQHARADPAGRARPPYAELRV